MKRWVQGFALVSIVVLAATAWSQDAPMEHGKMRMGESPGMKGCMQMMAEMETKDAALDELVARMQAAEGAEKVAAMEEILTALVTQRREMHRRMREMPQMTCSGMMMQ